MLLGQCTSAAAKAAVIASAGRDYRAASVRNIAPKGPATKFSTRPAACANAPRNCRAAACLLPASHGHLIDVGC